MPDCAIDVGTAFAVPIQRTPPELQRERVAPIVAAGDRTAGTYGRM
jgi:hypothetical protein